MPQRPIRLHLTAHLKKKGTQLFFAESADTPASATDQPDPLVVRQTVVRQPVAYDGPADLDRLARMANSSDPAQRLAAYRLAVGLLAERSLVVQEKVDYATQPILKTKLDWLPDAGLTDADPWYGPASSTYGRICLGMLPI